MADPTPTFAGEVQFRRYSDTSTQGTQIVLALPDREALQSFIGLEGKRFMAVLVQIGDDEQPVVDHAKSSTGAGSQQGPNAQRNGASTRVGDLCWRAVQWCKEPEFWDFLTRTYMHNAVIEGEDDAATAVKSICSVDSRKELDTMPHARDLFNSMIRTPYQKHLIARGIVR